MTDANREWTLENALKILHHPTVDAKSWSEAVEWLLLYGPPEVQELLQDSAAIATEKTFPDLKPAGCTGEGEMVFDVAELAKALDISNEEAVKLLADKEKRHGRRQIFDGDETFKVQ